VLAKVLRDFGYFLILSKFLKVSNLKTKNHSKLSEINVKIIFISLLSNLFYQFLLLARESV